MNVGKFYKVWTEYSGYLFLLDVVCFVPLIGYFGMRNNNICIVYPVKRNENGYLVSGMTIEYASGEDLRELEKSIHLGTCQLIALPYSGLIGNEKIILLNGDGHGSFYKQSGEKCLL